MNQNTTTKTKPVVCAMCRDTRTPYGGRAPAKAVATRPVGDHMPGQHIPVCGRHLEAGGSFRLAGLIDDDQAKAMAESLAENQPTTKTFQYSWRDSVIWHGLQAAFANPRLKRIYVYENPEGYGGRKKQMVVKFVRVGPNKWQPHPQWQNTPESAHRVFEPGSKDAKGWFA